MRVFFKRAASFGCLLACAVLWIFSGWPHIWHNPPFPPKIPRANAASEDVRPNTTASEAGGSCTTANAHTTLDDDVDSPGGDFCTADSSSANHDVHLQFGTPTAPPVTTTNAQTFKLRAQRSSNGGGDPTVALDLYCNGALVEAGVDQTLVGNNPVTVTETFTFNSGSCAADGSDVEVVLDCTAGGSGGGARSCNYDAVEWLAEVADPNAPPTLTVDEPNGTSDTVLVGENYSIQYDLADSDDTVTVAFFYDTDASGLDGTAIPGACASGAEGTNVTCSWNTTGVTPGSYYVYGVTDDGTNPAVSDYSPGQITIQSTIYSVSITSDGIIEYGSVELNTATSTVGSGDTQTAQNDGNATERLNVRSSDAVGGVTWTLASSVGSDQFTHEFSTTTGSSWTGLPDSSTYVLAAPSVTESGTVLFDFRLTTPSVSTDYEQKSITITVQAEAP